MNVALAIRVRAREARRRLATVFRPAPARGTPTDKAERREDAKTRRHMDLAARRAERVALKRQADAERTRRKEQRDAERRARETAAANAYVQYQRVRDWARSSQPNDGSMPLSEAEQQMVAGLAPLWDASPETIGSLRRWCGSIDGVRPTDYEPPSTELSLRLRRDLQVLQKQVGPGLFVQEPPALGGFGVVRAGERYNEATMMFFKAIAALQDGAVLAPFRAPDRRRLVWEIGGGWGGFAYQFKTLCPKVTYLVTGIPEQLLVSAVYLMTVFPDARCRLYTEPGREEFWRAWEDADFLFAPESALPSLRPPRVDMTLDIMALRTMEKARVASHVQRAFEFEARYFYSLLPATSAATEAPKVWSAIERRYWPHPVPPRGPEGIVYPPVTTPEIGYAHLVGWRRLRV